MQQILCGVGLRLKVKTTGLAMTPVGVRVSRGGGRVPWENARYLCAVGVTAECAGASGGGGGASGHACTPRWQVVCVDTEIGP